MKRSFVSLTAFSFVVLSATGIIAFFSPFFDKGSRSSCAGWLCICRFDRTSCNEQLKLAAKKYIRTKMPILTGQLLWC